MKTKKQKESKNYVNREKFDVTFKENKKYNPITRTIRVHAIDENHAKLLVQDEFDTFKRNEFFIPVPTEKRISISEVKKVEDKQG